MTTTPSLRTCRGCGAEAPLRELFDLGDVPSVNTFIPPEEVATERRYPLALFWCPTCTLVQLGDIVPPGELFTSYQHLSAASGTNVQHLAEVAETLSARLNLTSNSQVMDVGSNDGSLLACFKPVTAHVLGVDPAQNVAQYAAEKGVSTLTEFLTPAVAQRIIREQGHFDLIMALNVVAHTPAVVELLKAVQAVLTLKGTFIMEAVYVYDTILHGQFDTVYHEHVYCFSLTALSHLFKQAGLQIVDVERIPTQGGSLRVFGQRSETASEPTARVTELLAAESAQGVRDWARYQSVGDMVRAFKQQFRRAVTALKERHGRVVGLGAPARGVVILNYTAVTSELIDTVLDDTPLKQGRLVPGVHIPVISREAYYQQDPATAYVLLSWNYRDEWLAKLKPIGRTADVLVPFPKLETISVPVASAVHATS
jgi:hypothetical protein